MARKKRDDPRMNMTFYGDNLDFSREIADRNDLSITQFVNQFIFS